MGSKNSTHNNEPTSSENSFSKKKDDSEQIENSFLTKFVKIFFNQQLEEEKNQDHV